MRRYETIAIVDPDVSPDDRVVLFDRCQEIINQQNGRLLESDEWGSRKLAYEIKKKVRGFYVRFDYCGGGEVVNELERFFRIDERVLKFLTVLLEEKFDLQEFDEATQKTEETVETAEETASEESEIPAVSENSEAGSSEAPSIETPSSEIIEEK
jgi:small subunit ribosomal protein S6